MADPFLLGLLVGQLLLLLVLTGLLLWLLLRPRLQARQAAARARHARQAGGWGTGDTRTLPAQPAAGSATEPPGGAPTANGGPHQGHGPSRRWWLVSRFADGGRWWVVYESRLPDQAEPEHMTLEVPAPGASTPGAPAWP